MELALVALPGVPDGMACLLGSPLKSSIVLRSTKEGVGVIYGVYVAQDDLDSGRIVVIKNIK